MCIRAYQQPALTKTQHKDKSPLPHHKRNLKNLPQTFPGARQWPLSYLLPIALR